MAQRTQKIQDLSNLWFQKTLDVDTIIVCAGQLSNRDLFTQLKETKTEGNLPWNLHLISGAKEAGELDAKKAIKSAFELALTL